MDAPLWLAQLCPDPMPKKGVSYLKPAQSTGLECASVQQLVLVLLPTAHTFQLPGGLQ